MRKLTNIMLELLMDCHERELMKIEPLEVASTRYSAGLINRGFVIIKPYVTEKGKKYSALYVSNSGREFLKLI